jgi:hypothetical protein
MDDKKIDVKTKFRSHRPKLHYNAAVPLYQINNKAEYYVFFSIHEENNNFKCFMCGRCSKKFLLDNCSIWKKGDIDSNNGVESIEDSCVIEYGKIDRW